MKKCRLEDPIGVSLETLSPNHFCESESKGLEHPTPEQLMIRQGSKYLTPKQKKIWTLYNFDRLTQDEIAIKLSVSHQAVCKHIKAAENRIMKYVKDNYGAYELLKADYHVD